MRGEWSFLAGFALGGIFGASLIAYAVGGELRKLRRAGKVRVH